jgi:hypothetical protein
MSKSILLAAAAAFALAAPAFAQHEHGQSPGGHPHGAPPHGPHGGPSGIHTAGVMGPRFHSGPTTTLGAHDLGVWRGGVWRHERRFGRFGWWWFVGGWWYWYPEPIYPYPTEVTTIVYEDGGQYWYCEDPQGYWPYIRACPGGWHAVPTAPPDAQAAAQAGPPPGGPPPRY